MTARETTSAKARRLLSEGRLIVTRILDDVVDAVCVGDSGVWQLGHDPARGWWCQCPARGRCSHVAALRLVTTITARQGAAAERAA